MIRSRSTIFIRVCFDFPEFPAIISSLCQTQSFTCLLAGCTVGDCFIDQLYCFFAICGANHSPSGSPQIAFAFFDSTNNAAASASAFYFRCSSFSSFLRSFSESFSSWLKRAASLATPPLALRQSSFQDLICST